MNDNNAILRNLKLQFNAKVIKKMKELKLPIDHIGSVLFILFSLYEGRYDLLDEFDDESKEKRALLLYRDLERKGYIEQTDEHEEVMYILSKLGYALVDFVKEQFSEDLHAEELEPLAEVENVEDWIKQYINIFPVGKIEGKVLRASSVECIDKMKKFMSKYGYHKDIILDATRLYIEDEAGGQIHTRNSKYFIEKHDPIKGYISDLLAYCERVKNEKENPQERKINMDVL